MRTMSRVGFAAFAAFVAMSAGANLTDSAAAVGACMENGKTEQSQKDCIQGLALLSAIEALREVAMRPGTPLVGVPGASGTPVQVVTAPAKSGWQTFGDIVLGTVQFARDTAIALSNPIATVLVGRRNAQTQEILGSYQRDTQIATVNGFTTMGGHIQTAGTAGYPYIQAPGAVTTNTLSGTGAMSTGGGAATYTGPVTTTTTDNHTNPNPTVVTCVGTPTACATPK